MPGLQIETSPLCEPILLNDVKNYLKVSFTDDDTLISSFIVAARELVEGFTGRSLVNKGYVQTLDAFPYFTDSAMSQQAYPMSYYSLPRYSTSMWNYSQMIKLLVAPLTKLSSLKIIYMGTDSQYHTLLPGANPWRPLTNYTQGSIVLDGNGNLQIAQNTGISDTQPPNALGSSFQLSNADWKLSINSTTVEATGLIWKNGGPAELNVFAPGGISSNTFLADLVSEPPRLFPGPAGSFWPSVAFVPNAVEVHFIAGYGDPIASGSPVSYAPPTPSPDGHWNKCVSAMFQLIAGWYEHRESISPLALKDMPNHMERLLWSSRIFDFQPTRG